MIECLLYVGRLTRREKNSNVGDKTPQGLLASKWAAKKSKGDRFRAWGARCPLFKQREAIPLGDASLGISHQGGSAPCSPLLEALLHWVGMALIVCEVISHLKAVPSNPCQEIVHRSPRGLWQAGRGQGRECCCRCGRAGPSSSWQWRGARTFFPEDSQVFQRVFHSLYCTHMHTHTYGLQEGPRTHSMALVPHLLRAILKTGKGITKYWSAFCIWVSGLRLGPWKQI